MLIDADERSGKPVQITGTGGLEGGPGPMLHMFLSFSEVSLSKSNFADQVQVTPQLRVSFSNLV
jgi:hypothetical protein